MKDRWTFEEVKPIRRFEGESPMEILARKECESKPKVHHWGLDHIELAGDYILDKVEDGAKKLISCLHFGKTREEPAQVHERKGNESFTEFINRRVDESKPKVHHWGLDHIELAGDIVFDGIAYCAGTIKDRVVKKNELIVEQPTSDLNELIHNRAYKIGKLRAKGFFEYIEFALDSGVERVINYVRSVSSSPSLRKIAEGTTATIGAYSASLL